VFEETQQMRIRDLIAIAPTVRRKPHRADVKKSPTVGFVERYDPNQETTPEKIRDDAKRAVAQTHKPMTDELIYAMYGDEAGDLELARQRLELRRLAVEVRAAEAEIEATLAAAAKDRAEAERDRRSRF
jgi:hypothetical protein